MFHLFMTLLLTTALCRLHLHCKAARNTKQTSTNLSPNPMRSDIPDMQIETAYHNEIYIFAYVHAHIMLWFTAFVCICSKRQTLHLLTTQPLAVNKTKSIQTLLRDILHKFKQERWRQPCLQQSRSRRRCQRCKPARLPQSIPSTMCMQNCRES